MNNVNPYSLIRKNTIKKQSTYNLSQIEIDNFVDEFLSIRKEFDLLCEKIINVLEKEISIRENASFLNLKRMIYNQKLHKSIKYVQKILCCTDEPIKKVLMEYLDCAHRYIYILDKKETFYEKNVENSRKNLHIFSKNKVVQEYLLMISPDIYKKLKSYIETEPSLHRSRERKLDRTLYKVLARASFKTSPFGNVTKVGRLEIYDDISKSFDNREYKTKKHVKINFTILYRLALYYLNNSDEFFRNITYRIPPCTILNSGDSIKVEFVATVDNKKSSKIFETTEYIKSMRIVPQILKLFKNRSVGNDFGFEEFFSQVKEILSREEALCLIKKYVEIGLFIPTIGFSEKEDELLCKEILTKTKQFLENTYFNELNSIINFILSVKKKLLISFDLELRNEINCMISDSIKKWPVLSEIGVKVNNLFYEDYTLEEIFHDGSIVEDVYLSDLKTLQKFTLIFDVGIRLRLELGKNIFDKKLSLMNKEFFSLLFDKSKEILPYWSSPYYVSSNRSSEYVKILDELKSNFIGDFKQKILRNNNKNQVDISSLIEKYANLIPDELLEEVDLSSSFFIQKSGKYLIINNLYDGQEKYKARFMDYFSSYLTKNSNYLEFTKEYYINQNYIEYNEDFGFNGNIKKMSLPKQAITIGVGRRRFTKQDTEFIEVEKLKIGITEKTHMINFFDSNNKEINILYRGSLIPTAMPGYVATLLQLFSSGRMTFKFTDLISLDKIPRITFNNIIIVRKKYSLYSMSRYFIKLENESESDYYTRMLIQAKNKMIPYEFFVVAKREYNNGEMEFFDFKPFYVNVYDPISLKIFYKEIIEKYSLYKFKNLYIEEFLSNDGNYAEEYDMEIFKLKGKKDYGY